MHDDVITEALNRQDGVCHCGDPNKRGKRVIFDYTTWVRRRGARDSTAWFRRPFARSTRISSRSPRTGRPPLRCHI